MLPATQVRWSREHVTAPVHAAIHLTPQFLDGTAAFFLSTGSNNSRFKRFKGFKGFKGFNRLRTPEPIEPIAF